jgi:1-aminocyclopropane-1-carboxylate deaminase/D-cysteine desulfhydrase-like pyridoxal-dependent ACC family enzyme
MHAKWTIKYLALAVASSVLIGPLAQAGALGRAGFDDLSREMSTCAAYFSLLSSIVENSDGPAAKAEIALRIKSTGQAMLTQSINVAKYIGMGDDSVMERVQKALKEMMDTVNSDPPSSLSLMQTKYGQPCDELLQSAPQRFAELIEQHREDF